MARFATEKAVPPRPALFLIPEVFLEEEMNIEKYRRSDGAVNTATLRRISAPEVSEATELTDFLVSPTIGQRIKALILGVRSHPSCEFCGSSLPFSSAKSELFSKCRCAQQKSKNFADSITEEKKNKFRDSLRAKKEKSLSEAPYSLDICKGMVERAMNSSSFGEEIRKLCLVDKKFSVSVYSHCDSFYRDKRIAEASLSLVKEHSCKECGTNTRRIANSNSFLEYCKEHSNLAAEKKKKNAISKVNDFFQNHGFTVLSSPDGVNGGTFTVRCSKNHITDVWANNGFSGRAHYSCIECHPRSISNPEREIRTWLESYGIRVVDQHPISKKKNGVKTVDLFLPEHNIAIEYDGIMWHSFGKSKHSMFNNWESENKFCHVEKTEICSSLGIKLFRIFSNEWEDSSEKWKSVILNACGKTLNKVHARKTTVKILDSKESSNFFEENHLQGNANASIRIGLVDSNGELLCAMSLSKSRYSAKAQWEIVRFANKKYCSVVGGFSKLLSHFRKQFPGKIVSYANRRWSTGSLYEVNGFRKKSVSAPNYFYVSGGSKLESRQKYQRHLLGEVSERTEKEIMFDRGFRRIWDCGNLVYILD